MWPLATGQVLEAYEDWFLFDFKIIIIIIKVDSSIPIKLFKHILVFNKNNF